MRLYGKILWILIYSTTFSYAQKLDNLGKKGGISLSGGLAINQVLYKEFNQIQTMDPYNLFITANASLSLYGWAVPFSASYSNRKIAASQPFNRFSLHPTYKNLTIHLGFTSHTLSTYTMTGFPVNGLGLEHSGLGKFTFKTFYGTMNSTARNDSTGYLSYKRKGMGYSLGYHSEKALLDLSMLYSKDSIFNKNAESITLFPEQNLALGIGGIFTLAKFQLAIETGISTIDKQTSGKDRYANPPQSSRTDKALKMGLSYSLSRLALRLNYERIDPEYRTHGMYFMNNDLENISLTGALELSEGKGAVSITVGNQKNDLDGNKQSATNRFTGSGNIQYRPSEKLSFSGMYSNFKVVTNQHPENTLPFMPEEDSLTFIQLSTQALLQSTYAISESHSFSVNASFNRASDWQNNTETTSDFYSFNASHSFNQKEKKFRIITSLVGQYIQNNLSHGLSLMASKSSESNKTRNSLAANWNRQKNGNSNLMLRFSNTLKIGEKQNLQTSAGLQLSNRKSILNGRISYTIRL